VRELNSQDPATGTELAVQEGSNNLDLVRGQAHVGCWNPETIDPIYAAVYSPFETG